MGFGIDLDIKVPDVAGVANKAADAANSALSDAVEAATAAVASSSAAIADAAAKAVDAASAAASALAGVPGALADVSLPFTGALEDLVLEPHLVLDANASFEDTKFEKGPIWVRIEMTPEEAEASADVVHLFSESGEFDEQKNVCDFDDASDTTVGLFFDGAPMDESYSLEVVPSRGGALRMFSGVPYGQLRKTRQRFLEGDI